MKSRAKIIVKFLSLSIILSSFVFGLYAQNKYSGLLSLKTNTSKLKTSPKTNNSTDVKLAAILDLNVVEKARSLEDWMFDSFFWEIEKNVWNEEPVEEERKIEEWMINFKVIKEACMCIDIYSDFEEKEWMKEHNFFIL